MKNTHLQHPEDSILTGDLSVLDWFLTDGEISAKIDGSPRLYGAKIRRRVNSLLVQNRSLIRNLSRLTSHIVTLTKIILVLLLIYYTTALITFLISTGLFKVILLGLVVMILIAPIRSLMFLMK